MSARWLMPWVALAVLVSATAPARAAGESFAAGNDAYQAFDYAEAVRQYEALVAGGIRNEQLFYNLANAHYRMAAGADDQLGRAIYNYERALRVAPGFEDARFNLDVAREAVAAKVADRIEAAERDPFWVSVVTAFSVSQLTVGFLVLVALVFSALIALRFLPSGFARTGALVAAAFTGIAAMVAGALLWGHVRFVEDVQLAIVLPDEVQMREAPAQPQSDRGQVHAGLRVYIVARESSWVRVRLSNGHEGWLPAADVGEL